MTGIYNVLEKLRRGEPVTSKDKLIHEQGLVSVLRQLHDDLDAAVLAAYGWEDVIPPLRGSAAPGATGPGRPAGAAGGAEAPLPPAEAEEELLTRLVALNAARAAEESRGVVRWLRPEFQCPAGLAAAEAGAERELPLATATAAAGPKPAWPKTLPEQFQVQPAWPKTLPEQFQVLRAALAEQAARGGPVGIDQLAQAFARAPRAKVAELLDTLAALGHACRLDDGRYLPG